MATINDSSRSDLLLNGSSSDPIQDYNVKLVNCLYPSDVNEDQDKGGSQDASGVDADMDRSYDHAKGTWYNRAFSPITPGSLRGSTFTLISTALGAGILSLPKMYSNTGLVLGTIFLVLAGLAALWSMYLLSKSSFRTGTKRYSDAVLNLLGKRWNLVLQIVLIIYVFGALVGYLITLNQFVGDLAGGFGIVSKAEGQSWSDATSDQYYHTYFVISIVGLLSYPICCIKNLSGLRYLTIFSVLAICYIIITIVWEAPVIASKDTGPREIEYFKISWEAVTSWAVCAFAFTCHVNVFPVISELQRSSQKRATKIFNRCITVEEIMYLSAGLGGYLSTLNNTPAIFITRDATVGPYDIFMIIGQLAMALNLFLVLPVNLNPCRLQIMILFGKEKNPSNLLHYGLTAGIVVAASGLAMLFPNIYSVFGLLGGFFATMLSYTFPALIYLKCTKLRKGHYKKSLVYFIAFMTTFMGFFSATVILFQLFGVIPSS